MVGGKKGIIIFFLIVVILLVTCCIHEDEISVSVTPKEVKPGENVLIDIRAPESTEVMVTIENEESGYAKTIYGGPTNSDGILELLIPISSEDLGRNIVIVEALELGLWTSDSFTVLGTSKPFAKEQTFYIDEFKDSLSYKTDIADGISVYSTSEAVIKKINLEVEVAENHPPLPEDFESVGDIYVFRVSEEPEEPIVVSFKVNEIMDPNGLVGAIYWDGNRWYFIKGELSENGNEIKVVIFHFSEKNGEKYESFLGYVWKDVEGRIKQRIIEIGRDWAVNKAYEKAGEALIEKVKEKIKSNANIDSKTKQKLLESLDNRKDMIVDLLKLSAQTYQGGDESEIIETCALMLGKIILDEAKDHESQMKDFLQNILEGEGTTDAIAQTSEVMGYLSAGDYREAMRVVGKTFVDNTFLRYGKTAVEFNKYLIGMWEKYQLEQMYEDYKRCVEGAGYHAGTQDFKDLLVTKYAAAIRQLIIEEKGRIKEGRVNVFYYSDDIIGEKVKKELTKEPSSTELENKITEFLLKQFKEMREREEKVKKEQERLNNLHEVYLDEFEYLMERYGDDDAEKFKIFLIHARFIELKLIASGVKLNYDQHGEISVSDQTLEILRTMYTKGSRAAKDLMEKIIADSMEYRVYIQLSPKEVGEGESPTLTVKIFPPLAGAEIYWLDPFDETSEKHYIGSTDSSGTFKGRFFDYAPEPDKWSDFYKDLDWRKCRIKVYKNILERKLIGKKDFVIHIAKAGEVVPTETPPETTPTATETPTPTWDEEEIPETPTETTIEEEPYIELPDEWVDRQQPEHWEPEEPTWDGIDESEEWTFYKYEGRRNLKVEARHCQGAWWIRVSASIVPSYPSGAVKLSQGEDIRKLIKIDVTVSVEGDALRDILPPEEREWYYLWGAVRASGTFTGRES